MTVTVKSVKERELPEPDDEFAQLASEFDTIDELKSSLTDQVQQVKRIQQAEQIRDKALEVLLEQVEVPLPENDRAGPGRRQPCTTPSTASTTTRPGSPRRSRSRAAAARSSTPTTGATRRRPSKPSC